MLIPTIEIKAKGFVVRSTARDFPCLDDLEWVGLKPAGLAPNIPARLGAVPVVGRAA